MFGYITANRPELKVREDEEYHSYYCGVCDSLRRRTGKLSQVTLTYDMTFLAVLLTGLYEEPLQHQFSRCSARPWRKMKKVTNRYTEYAADMNVLLACRNLEDDWLDDRNLRSRILAGLLSRSCRKVEARWPRQSSAVAKYLTDLHTCEEERSPDPDRAAGLTGEMLAEIFVPEEDIWSSELRHMGYYLGKFIYLMDAFEDREEDAVSGSYNPWNCMEGVELTDDYCRSVLTMMMSESSRAFERLPILENAGILRNILYSGVWCRFAEICRKKDDPQDHPKDPKDSKD